MKPSYLGMACIAMSLLSCGRNASHESKEVATADIIETTAPVASETQAPDTNTHVLQAGSPANNDWDKKIIKTAEVTLELKDYNVFDNNIHQSVKAYGAYIASEKQNHTGYELRNSITIKVPVAQFDALVNSLSGTDIQVLEKNISTEDVSSEIVDIKARLEAKKQVRERYLDLLKQAKNMKDILSVQQEINSIQEDIEAADGRANYLVHQSAYSTINLTYYQPLGGGYTGKPGFLSKLGDAFSQSLDGLESFLLFIVFTWPLWLVLTAGYWFYRKRKRTAFAK